MSSRVPSVRDAVVMHLLVPAIRGILVRSQQAERRSTTSTSTSKSALSTGTETSYSRDTEVQQWDDSLAVALDALARVLDLRRGALVGEWDFQHAWCGCMDDLGNYVGGALERRSGTLAAAGLCSTLARVLVVSSPPPPSRSSPRPDPLARQTGPG